MVIVEYQAHVTVTGQNFGDVASTWGPNGWMEQAAQQFAYGQSGPYIRSTENLAYNLKQTYGADSVILCFFTHDDKGSTAIGPDQGYADKVLVSYWGIGNGGIRFNSEPGSYEHETVHAYGALDEWGGNGIECNFWPSGLAVSPMHEMYRNTNFYTCPGSTHSGVMYSPYDAFLYPWWEISQASRKWIGWGDFDTDGTLDPLDARPAGNNDKIGIFRSSTGYWYLNYNFDDSYETSFYYGGSGDIPVVGDWDGNENADIGYFRPSTGYWYLDSHKDGTTDFNFRLGNTGDIPIVGDWNGNGYSDVAVFRPSTGYWYFDNNLNGVVDNSFRYGGSTDKIVKGDWQGTGRDGIAIFRPSTGYWYFDYNLDGTVDNSFRYGGSTDRIIVGNWAGYQDGIAIFRPSTGYWYFDYNLDGTVDKSFRYGGSSDQILKGDWDGDGRDGIGIFRPSTGYWYLDSNLDGTVDKSFRYGGSTDTIIVGRWI